MAGGPSGRDGARPLRRRAGALRVVLALLRWGAAAADEMAFVDVFATDKMDIRSLDVRVAPARGAGSLFVADPMAAHDWVVPRSLEAALEAEIAAAAAGVARSAAARRQERLRAEMAPLFAALPKNAHGNLTNATARYALRRHFERARGWRIKGLEPAAAAWVLSMSVTPDVRQITKYIVPAYLQERVLQRVGGADLGFDLQWLSIMAALLEHLVHSEMTEYLYSLLRALELPVSGTWSAEMVQAIASDFMLVYAFGGDLEVSSRRDLVGMRRYLESHHHGWTALQAWVAERLRGAEPPPRNFSSVLGFLEAVADGYAEWQERDCKLARQALDGAAGRSGGRVPLSCLSPRAERGHRVIFAEDEQHLAKLGVLAASADNGGALLVPNYLLSQAMCLPTASFYQVCCRSACDELLERVERRLRSPAGAPGEVVEALPELADAQRARASLDAAAVAGGRIQVHSREFAQWLHDQFPLICPQPAEQPSRAHPATADEWSAEPTASLGDIDALLGEIAEVFARYTTLGAEREGEEQARDESEEPRADDVDRIYGEATRRRVRVWRFSPGTLLLGAVAAAVGVAIACAALGALGAPSGALPMARRGAAPV